MFDFSGGKKQHLLGLYLSFTFVHTFPRACIHPFFFSGNTRFMEDTRGAQYVNGLGGNILFYSLPSHLSKWSDLLWRIMACRSVFHYVYYHFLYIAFTPLGFLCICCPLGDGRPRGLNQLGERHCIYGGCAFQRISETAKMRGCSV